MFGTTPLQNLTTNVAAVAAAGAAIPAEYTRIIERWDAYSQLDAAAFTDKLSAAMINGDNSADLAQLHALALASRAGAVELAELRGDLEAPIFLALRNAYEPVAAKNYKSFADQFSNTAAAFTKATQTCDPDTPAAQMVEAADKQRKAWTDAALLATQLDQQLPTLVIAAELAGLTALTTDRQLPLVCDPADLHRRRVWEAWDTTNSRAGHWAALVRAGVQIRALADVEDYQPYRRPQPLQEKQVMVGRGISKTITIDPEDDEQQAEAAIA